MGACGLKRTAIGLPTVGGKRSIFRYASRATWPRNRLGTPRRILLQVPGGLIGVTMILDRVGFRHKREPSPTIPLGLIPPI